MVIGDDFVSRKVASKDSESKRRLRLRECQCLVSLADVTQVSAVSRLGLKAALYTPQLPCFRAELPGAVGQFQGMHGVCSDRFRARVITVGNGLL